MMYKVVNLYTRNLLYMCVVAVCVCVSYVVPTP